MASRFASVLFLSLLLPSFTDAQDAPAPTAVVKDVPLAIPFDDARLKWGPCPPFIPEGCQIAALRGDPSTPHADLFFKVPGDFRIPRHWHTSAERMVLVSGEMTVNYEGQPAVTLKPGMYAYGPAKLAHEATCAKGDPCVLFIAFEEPVDAFASTDPAP